MGTEHSVPKNPPPSTPKDQKYHPKTSLQHTINNFPSEITESTKPSAGSLTFKKRKSSRSLTASAKPQKQMKNVFIRLENGSQVKISFEVAQQDKLTCSWLVSEAISQLAQENLLQLDPRRPIVALQTLDHLIPLDYWLSCPGKSISVLKDGIVLTPFYGDNDFKIQGQKINLSFFHIVKLIGSGGFSKVYLIRRKDNGTFYALKVIVKEGMSDQELKALVNEREVFVRVNHPFVAKLHFAFQTTGQLFLIMDFFPGGELYYNLQQKKKITEAQAKVYVGEVILALSYLHKNKILYRDLKPENLLLDIDGHLNLTDFGLCKQVRNRTDLNYTFCGSPEYLAPEVINETGYNFSVDYYGLGVLVYEMVIGETPFSVKNKNQDLFTKIVANKIKFPKGISSDLKSFISSLMKADQNQRLGAKNGFIEIINHPWCRDIDFFEIATKKTKAPIVPDLYKMNFAEYYLDKEITLEEENSISLNTEPAEHFPIENNLMEDSLAQEIDSNLFKNFSFYKNVDDCEKYTDSVFVIKEENVSEIPRQKNRITEEDCDFQGRNEMMKPEFKVKSGKNPKLNTLPKIHLDGFEDCQENYVDDDEEEQADILKRPLSLKKIPSTTTQRLQTLDRTGTSPFINYVQTQTTILTHSPFSSKQRTFDFDLTIKKVKSHDVRAQELSFKFGSGFGSDQGVQVPQSLVKKSTLTLGNAGNTTLLSTNLMEDSSTKYPKSSNLHFEDTDSGSPVSMKVLTLKKHAASTSK